MVRSLISRRFDFSASHRYYRQDWTAEKNEQVFGLCALPNGHGHNYGLEVAISGTPDIKTGMIINLSELEATVDRVLTEFDHKNLNLDTPYFVSQIPTTENLAVVLWNLISACLGETRLHRIRLYETEDVFVEYFGEYE